MDSPCPTGAIGELRAALKAGEYDRARRYARQLSNIGSTDQLRLMALAARQRVADYERLAGEWIDIAIKEGVVGLADLEWVTPMLLAIQRGKTQEIARLLMVTRRRHENGR